MVVEEGTILLVLKVPHHQFEGKKQFLDKDIGLVSRCTPYGFQGQECAPFPVLDNQ